MRHDTRTPTHSRRDWRWSTAPKAPGMIAELRAICVRRGRDLLTIHRRLIDDGYPISYRQLSRWWNGRVAPTVDQVEIVARAAGVDLAYLIPEEVDA